MTDFRERDDSDRDHETGTPRWVKAFGLVLGVLLLLFVVLHLTGVAGRHGLGGMRHGPPSADTRGGHQP